MSSCNYHFIYWLLCYLKKKKILHCFPELRIQCKNTPTQICVSNFWNNIGVHPFILSLIKRLEWKDPQTFSSPLWVRVLAPQSFPWRQHCPCLSILKLSSTLKVFYIECKRPSKFPDGRSASYEKTNLIPSYSTTGRTDFAGSPLHRLRMVLIL